MCIFNVNIDNFKKIDNSSTIMKQRQNIADSLNEINIFNSKVTIMVLAYNRIEKTKQCLESILKYTNNVDYDLLLVDNGSTDDTLEYFKSIKYDKIRIIHFNKNISATFCYFFIPFEWISKYYVIVANDIIVTSNWLTNLITTAESDEHIGMVNPVSSNVSNLQEVILNFNDVKCMQSVAEKYNLTNSTLWNERLRIVTLCTLFKKECLMAIGWPYCDGGFTHDFGDDDITFRVRRAGYKAILAKDTWIHHNHDFRNTEDKDPIEFQKSIEMGRKNFREKYFGIDAWDDVNNFIPEYLSALKVTSKTERARVLGIDVRCGTPILEIKNALRKFDIFDTECSAHTVDAKYTIDLQTVCGASNVFSGSINGFSESFEQNSFDYIVIGNDINTYSDPFRILKSAYKLLRTNGQLFFSLHNTNNIFNFAYSIGLTSMRDTSHAIDYTVEEILEQLMQQGYNVKFIAARGFEVGAVSQELLSNVNLCFDRLPINDRSETMYRLTSEHYYLVISREET